MKLESGRYVVETWSEYGIDYKQYRMAAVVTEGSYSVVVTTAIKMQVKNGEEYAIRIEDMSRYLDSFGDDRKTWFEEKVLKDFRRFVTKNRKVIEESGGCSFDLDFGKQVHLFVENKLDFVEHTDWKYAYAMAGSDAHELSMKRMA